jgi:hypothetical protein
MAKWMCCNASWKFNRIVHMYYVNIHLNHISSVFPHFLPNTFFSSSSYSSPPSLHTRLYLSELCKSVPPKTCRYTRRRRRRRRMKILAVLCCRSLLNDSLVSRLWAVSWERDRLTANQKWYTLVLRGTRWRSCLRHYALFSIDPIPPAALWHYGVDSPSNRNEYQESTCG